MPRRRRGWAMNGPHGASQDIRSPLTTSLVEPTLLMLISQKPDHGYNLLNELEKQEIGRIHPSIVYRTLREMEALGWIQSTWNTKETQGPPRRDYEITDFGKQALQNWKSELEHHKVFLEKLLKEINL